MDAIRRTLTLRRVATTASLAALLVAPGTADAKKPAKPKPPVITSVKPMEAKVGDTLVIKGRNFRKGKAKNSVGFKRAGAAVVFARAGVSTTRVMAVKVPARLEKVLYGGQPAQFSLRVLSKRFGRSFTTKKLSPTIGPKPAEEPGTGGPGGPGGPSGPGEDPAFDPAGPEGDCDADKTPNKDETGDLDNDLLSDVLEKDRLGTDECDADSDNDLVSDAFEYKSAVDLNDDEYQHPNVALPYPGTQPYPYPNPLIADSDKDFDGDGLRLGEEYALWSKQGGLLPSDDYKVFETKPLLYSDGLQYSIYEYCPSAANPAPCGADDKNRRVPALSAAEYAQQGANATRHKHGDFLAWAAAAAPYNGDGRTWRYDRIRLHDPEELWWDHVNREEVDIRDVNRSGGALDARDCQLDPNDPDDTKYPGEALYYDADCDGFLSDDERDEDADGLTNFDETNGPMSRPSWWDTCYSAESPYRIVYAGTDVANPDSDGDGIRDGADDQDHDDLPNMMELSRADASRGQPGADPHYGYYFADTKSYCVVRDGLDAETPNHPSSYGKVQPFDPCDPAMNSRTCERHPVFGGKADPNWWALQ